MQPGRKLLSCEVHLFGHFESVIVTLRGLLRPLLLLENAVAVNAKLSTNRAVDDASAAVTLGSGAGRQAGVIINEAQVRLTIDSHTEVAERAP